MNIIEEIKKIICEHSDLDIREEEIMLDMDLINELGINSIGMIMIIVDIEEKFDISLDNDEFDYSIMTKVDQLVNLVTDLLEEK